MEVHSPNASLLQASDQSEEAPFSGFCGLPSLISQQLPLKSIWSVSEELISLYLCPTCKHLLSVTGEEKRVSSLADEGCVVWLTDMRYSWIADPYSIFEADRVWNQTAGIWEKLAREHFWWNNINKDRWVFAAKPDQHSDERHGMRNQPGTWGLTGCLFMFSVQNVHLNWGLLQHNLFLRPWTWTSAAAPGCVYGLLPLDLSSWIVPLQYPCPHSGQQLSNTPDSSSLIPTEFEIILLNNKLWNLLPAEASWVDDGIYIWCYLNVPLFLQPVMHLKKN